jgi:hypothetical protein
VFILFYRTSSIDVFIRSLDLPLAPSSSSAGHQRPSSGSIAPFVRSSATFLWLHRHLHQVVRPPSCSVVVLVRSIDLPPAPSPPSSGRQRPSSGSIASFVRSSATFLWLHLHLRQVVRPPSGSVVVFDRSLDLPPALSSFSSGRSTSLHLRRHPRQVSRPSSGSVIAFASSEDLPRILRQD